MDPSQVLLAFPNLACRQQMSLARGSCGFSFWFPAVNASQSVKINIGRAFLRLIDRHFGTDHSYHRIFNRSTVKLSYSCMPNASSIIKASNKKILARANDSRPDTKMCSCTNKTSCPLQGKCLTRNVIYEARVSSGNRTMTYISFKSRYVLHSQTLLQS